MPLNPNRARQHVDGYSTQSERDQVRSYPQFFKKVRIVDFRHLHNVTVSFEHPITVISGSNRCGKTSLLMTIACSHYNFDRPDVVSGQIKRATWSDVVRFTYHDLQSTDWSYAVTYREGNRSNTLQGRRGMRSKKWSGVAKKDGQIGHPTRTLPNGGRHVCIIDLNRITPARHFSKVVYRKARGATRHNLTQAQRLVEYLSYILETPYSNIERLISHADSAIYCLSLGATPIYSSFNTASGEDVLINLLDQILDMPENSLVLIDEIEIGLHPKIQRRLMDILFMISMDHHIQFIMVSHSYAVIDSVPAESRIFLNNVGGIVSVKTGLSTYETLTRMDSHAFPCLELYVEDDVSHMIVDKAIIEINAQDPGFSRLVKVYETGSADKTYGCFKSQRFLVETGRLGATPVCVLDGDMRYKRDRNGDLQYPAESDLFFHHGAMPPEKMLLGMYLSQHPDENLQYHHDRSNPHCLFEKMKELGHATNKIDAFEKTFTCYRNDAAGRTHFDQLKTFIYDHVRNHSH